ncbi:unnamed protein product, partial [Gongylonema pulchrum]|uniref:Long chronological lifespan protein 2 n=1 Tax=Gongylonema pulchrum TaxID=637853 RepID=A0A183DF75_9BILA
MWMLVNAPKHTCATFMIIAQTHVACFIIAVVVGTKTILLAKPNADSGAKAQDVPPPGNCPYGQRPLGDNAPVLCGNETESFECPVGYYCRMGPPH